MTRLLGFLAVLLAAARLFTGIVYEADDPTCYLVLKHAPSLAITANNVPERRVRDDFTVLDDDENTLAYGDAYEWLMRWAPLLAAGCALGSLRGCLPRHRHTD